MSSALERKLPESGEVIGGKYRIVRRIGEGGMGVVYEAMHMRIQQRVAIKMLLPEVLDYPDVVPRFEREARAAGKLRSDNTARVLDVDLSEGGVPFMVMEYLEGSDLGQILETEGALPIPDAVDCVMQACNAMAEAHAEGIVHRDLKPSNLFVIAGMKVKLLDFGISKLENDKDVRVTATQTVVGTPLYMSPEQVRSAKHVDARSDIWSLGIILYELLARRTPFEGNMTAAAAAICIDAPPPIAHFRDNVPKGLEEAILGALEKDPNARVQSVQAFAALIAPYGSGKIPVPGGEPVRPTSGRILPLHSDPTLPQFGSLAPRAAGSATIPGWTTRSHPGKRRTRWVLAMFGGVALGALGVGAIVMRQSSRHSANDAPLVQQPTIQLTPSASVSNDVALPSSTIGATNVGQPTATSTSTHVQQQPHTHPTLTTATATTTATAPATHTVAPPAPTRL